MPKLEDKIYLIVPESLITETALAELPAPFRQGRPAQRGTIPCRLMTCWTIPAEWDGHPDVEQLGKRNDPKIGQKLDHPDWREPMTKDYQKDEEFDKIKFVKLPLPLSAEHRAWFKKARQEFAEDILDEGGFRIVPIVGKVPDEVMTEAVVKRKTGKALSSNSKAKIR